jgi:hypothetical protein
LATFNKFNSFTEALAEKVHNLGSDTLKILLTNTPPVATNTVKANLTEIGAGNGYSAGGPTVTVSSSAQTSGTYKLVIDDVTITASGGSIGPFQYFVLYNDTASNDELIGYWNYGSAVTLANGESITADFSASNGCLQIS